MIIWDYSSQFEFSFSTNQFQLIDKTRTVHHCTLFIFQCNRQKIVAKRPAYWNLKKFDQFLIVHIYSFCFIVKYWPFYWPILQRAVAVWDFEKLVFRSWKTEIPVVSHLPGEENIIVLRKKIAPSPYCRQYYKYNS